jgi:hypoxia up-regulated 1
MQFSNARELAEELAGEKVKDAVVSVPGWFNQFERQAVIDALEIGGLKSLGLINDGTAGESLRGGLEDRLASSLVQTDFSLSVTTRCLSVAMNYAMTRLFPTKEHHLIYDSGSLSTSATVISFHTYLTTPVSALLTSKNKKSVFKPKQVNTTHIEVLGLGWDRELGGTTLDNMIKEQLVEEFETKVLKGKKIAGKEREKAMAKVAKEAAKVKSVLSANSDSSVNVSAPPCRTSRKREESLTSHLSLALTDRVVL